MARSKSEDYRRNRRSLEKEYGSSFDLLLGLISLPLLPFALLFKLFFNKKHK